MLEVSLRTSRTLLKYTYMYIYQLYASADQELFDLIIVELKYMRLMTAFCM